MSKRFFLFNIIILFSFSLFAEVDNLTIEIKNPQNSPSLNTTPTFQVTGPALLSGDVVRIFTDPICQTQVAAQISTGGSVQITSSPLSPGNYSFYFNIEDTEGFISDCLGGIYYEVLAKSETPLYFDYKTNRNHCPSLLAITIEISRALNLKVEGHCESSIPGDGTWLRTSLKGKVQKNQFNLTLNSQCLRHNVTSRLAKTFLNHLGIRLSKQDIVKLGSPGAPCFVPISQLKQYPEIIQIFWE